MLILKRIDLVYNSVRILDKGNGVTTVDVSDLLNLERSNISKDLNALVAKGMLTKNNSRPVRFFYEKKSNSAISTMDTLPYLYPSLIPAIKLSKTAILYPPNGLNTLIIGDTGVGKSMLANLMHEYASSLDREKDIPFLHFNCSDFSSNPQLLSAQLFGVKKGTFTGATEDRSGLIEQADGGFLFLDEIHNLPNEGQEMLFVYMDTGYFKRFGEVKNKIKSTARIICATNKDINSSLLDTFIRRIPIKIYLPSLQDRLLEERLTLIEYFIKSESIKLEKPILVSYNSMLCFLSYPCPHNVGQLKNDIKLAIANAYSEYIINNKKQIRINSPDLPKDMKETLDSPLSNEKALLNSLSCDDGYFKYDQDYQILSHSFLKQKQFILESFKNLLQEISKVKFSDNTTDIINFFSVYLDNIKSCISSYQFSLEFSAFEEVIKDMSDLDKHLQVQLTDDIVKQFLHIHLDMIYDRVNLIVFDSKSVLSKLAVTYPTYHTIASSLKNIIEKTYNINLSTAEDIFLVLFTIYLYKAS